MTMNPRPCTVQPVVHASTDWATAASGNGSLEELVNVVHGCCSD